MSFFAKISWLQIIFLAPALLLSCLVKANDNAAVFDVDFLRNNKGITPEQLYEANWVAPGDKDVEVVINGRSLFKRKVSFIKLAGQKSAVACLNADFLHQARIESHDLAVLTKEGEHDCFDLTGHWPGSLVSYDEAMQQLLVTIPQEAMSQPGQEAMIDPALWDEGVNALRVNYSGYVYHSEAKDQWNNSSSSDDSAWMSLDSGITLGAWHFFSFDTFNKTQEGWDNNHDRAYVERDLSGLVSRLTIGDVYASTASDVLGVLPVRGVSMETNTQMLPSDRFSYSPVIRGVARSNAKIVIRQRGNIIYSKTVPPGSFAITDLSNGQRGADLDVTVEESDGSQQQFVVPFTSLPDMLRPGSWRYAVSAGQYRDNTLRYQPPVFQGSLQYGFGSVTLGGLLLVGDGYRSAALSQAFNLGYWGSVSADLAFEQHQLVSDMSSDTDSRPEGHGQAIRLQYARQFDATNTYFQLMGYHYQSSSFLAFPDYVNWRWGNDDDDFQQRKNRLETTINQTFGGWGSAYLTLAQDSYYSRSERDRSMTLGYNVNLKKVNLGVNYSLQQHTGEQDDRQLSLNVSIPLDWSDHHPAAVSFTTTSDNHHSGSQMATLSGSELDSTLNYSLSAQYDQDGDYSPSASASYRGSMANVTASASSGRNNRQYSAGISGGLVAYKNGVVLSQSLGDTIAIVETPGAKDISVGGQPGVRTNRWGRAVVPSMMAYRDNPLELDTAHAADNIELAEGGQNIVPTHGAIVVRRFETRVGRRALVLVSLANHQLAPFGATAWQDKAQVGMVADNGLLYLSGVLSDSNTAVRLQWGDDGREQCQFILPALQPGEAWYQQHNVQCH